MENFRETSSKKIILITKEDKNKINFKRTPELVYGLRNFIGNAVKFSKSFVEVSYKVSISSNKNMINVSISG